VNPYNKYDNNFKYEKIQQLKIKKKIMKNKKYKIPNIYEVLVENLFSTFYFPKDIINFYDSINKNCNINDFILPNQENKTIKINKLMRKCNLLSILTDIFNRTVYPELSNGYVIHNKQKRHGEIVLNLESYLFEKEKPCVNFFYILSKKWNNIYRHLFTKIMFYYL
jgi:hypothetical protein